MAVNVKYIGGNEFRPPSLDSAVMVLCGDFVDESFNYPRHMVAGSALNRSDLRTGNAALHM